MTKTLPFFIPAVLVEDLTVPLLDNAHAHFFAFQGGK